MVHGDYLQEGTTVALKFKDGSKFRGRVSRVAKNKYDLQILKRDQIETRTVGVSDVKSLKRFDADERRATIFAWMGFVTGGGTLTVIILALAGAL
jgi:hypothetical protein